MPHFPLGFAIEQKGQRFTPLAVKPWTRIDGSPTSLVEWSSTCHCGASYVTRSPLVVKKPLARRCGPCREGDAQK